MSISTEDILSIAATQPEPEPEPRDPELWRVAKLLAESQGISREEAWSIVETRGDEIKAKQEADRAARIAAEKAEEAAQAAQRATEAQAALDAMLRD